MSQAAKPHNRLFAFRVMLLLTLLALAIIGWRFVQNLGGPTEIIPELLSVHTERETAGNEAIQARIDTAVATLANRRLALRGRIDAAADLAEIGLERKKSYVASGLSVGYGQTGAEMRIGAFDNTDLHAAASALERLIAHKNERLRLEAAYALSHLQLYERHAGLVPAIRRALQDEYNVAIKTYLARVLGDIGPPAESARVELTWLLEEDEPVLLASAARAFSKIGPGGYDLTTEAQLIALLGHDSASVRESSAEALGAIGALSQSGEAALRLALDDPDAHVRVAAGLGLADLALTDSDVTDALAEGYALAPETTLFVEDVARTFEVRARVAEHFANLGQVPDVLVPQLVEMARQTQDIDDKEKLVAMLANTSEFSPSRVAALLELLTDPRFGFYYAVVDGLVAMGPDVLPRVDQLLEHEQPMVRELAAEIRRKLQPPRLKSAPVADPALIASFEEATDSFVRMEIAVTMSETGDATMLQYILDHRDVRVLNGPIYDVVVNRLIRNLRQYGFSPTHDQDAKRLALQSLGYLGVLTDSQLETILQVSAEPDVGDRVRQIWYDIKSARPRPPTLKETLETLYGGAESPRNKEVRRLAGQLLVADPRQRSKAIDGLKRIADHAVEAPGYLFRALRDPSERVRGNALDGYVGKKLTTNESLAVLSAIFLASHQSDRLNHDAAIGLAQIGPPALDALREGAGHEAVAVRRAAAYGLWKMGADAKPARTLLEKLAQDPHRGVSTYAQSALDELGGAR
jgi:HEAT repeat protein